MKAQDFAGSPPRWRSLFGTERVEERLISLESQLHLVEYRIRKDLLERDRVWRERIAAAMSLLCRMLAAVSGSPLPRRKKDPVSKALGELPIPDLEPRALTLEEYHAHTPEKFELWDGYLFSTADDSEARRRLLGVLLANVGLLDAVRLAPEERWREALERAFGSSGP